MHPLIFASLLATPDLPVTTGPHVTITERTRTGGQQMLVLDVRFHHQEARTVNFTAGSCDLPYQVFNSAGVEVPLRKHQELGTFFCALDLFGVSAPPNTPAGTVMFTVLQPISHLEGGKYTLKARFLRRTPGLDTLTPEVQVQPFEFEVPGQP